MQSQINPTRLELTKLKKQLAVTTRGFNLLKDKLDEMIREFFPIISEYKELKSSLINEYTILSNYYRSASINNMFDDMDIVFKRTSELSLNVTTSKIMNIEVPKLSLIGNMESLSLLNLNEPIELSLISSRIKEFLIKFILFCEKTKTIETLALEIERSRRRVNAIEHIMIPEIVANIKTIRFKLDENERSNQIRLMKSKDIILKKAMKDTN